MPKQFSIDPKKLRPNPWNTNIVSPENEQKLGNSLRELGQFKPVVVRELRDDKTDTDFEILGGQHRWTEAIEAKWKTIDVYNVGAIEDDKAKKISLADNARYGSDDLLELAKLSESIGGADALQQFLPWSDAEVNAMSSSTNIALSDLDLPEDITKEVEEDEAPLLKAPKTHTVMRFKVAIADAERITTKIVEIQKDHGFTASDELTNAGDALTQLILSGAR